MIKQIVLKRKVLFREDYLIDLKDGRVYFCNKLSKDIISFIIRNNKVDRLTIVKKFGNKAKNLLSQLECEGVLRGSEYIQKNNSLPNNRPFFLQWHITKKCNLRCKHCYFKDYNEESDFKTLKNYFSQIERLSRSLNKKLLITITGGEPLLHPELIPLIDYLNKKKTVKEIHIASNGTLLTDQLVTQFKKQNVKKIQISLDGTEKTHDEIRGMGSFQKAINGIKITRKYNLKVCIQMVISKKNINEIDNVLEILKNLDVNEVRFSLFVPTGTGVLSKNLALSKKNVKKIFYQLRRLSQKYEKPKILKHRPLWCLINKKWGGACDFDSGTCLMPNGDLYPCSRLPISIGNIHKEKIFEIWYKSDFMWLHRQSKNLKGKCHNCQFVKECGGCRALAFAYSGDALEEDPTCWLNS